MNMKQKNPDKKLTWSTTPCSSWENA